MMKRMEKGEIDRALGIVRRTGRMEWGGKKAKQAVERGNVDLVIIAENSPAAAREELEYYAKLSGVSLVEYPGTSWDLGEACGRPHMVSALIIRDEGDSRLTERKDEADEEEG